MPKEGRMDIPANHQQINPDTKKPTGEQFTTFAPDGHDKLPPTDLKNPDLKARFDEVEAAKVNEAAAPGAAPAKPPAPGA
jgi:hypothetical protein